MPAFLIDQNDRRVLQVPVLDHPHGLFFHFKLHLLAELVAIIERPGDVFGLFGIVGTEKPCAQIGFMNPASGVNARAEDESGIVGCDRRFDPGDFHERPYARVQLVFGVENPVRTNKRFGLSEGPYRRPCPAPEYP